jgi:hypothetical protein
MSVKVAVRLPDNLHAALLKIAKNEGSTFTAAIVGALNDALAAGGGNHGRSSLEAQSAGMARADQKQSGDEKMHKTLLELIEKRSEKPLQR